jgi:hypothetical protein
VEMEGFDGSKASSLGLCMTLKPSLWEKSSTEALFACSEDLRKLHSVRGRHSRLNGF